MSVMTSSSETTWHVLLASLGTVLLAFMPWSQLSLEFQVWTTVAAVLLLGLPHGAYDAWLVFDGSHSRARAALTLFVYLGVVVAGYLLWQRFPVPALVLFLALSI